MSDPGYPLNLYQPSVTLESIPKDGWPPWWSTNPPWDYNDTPDLEDLIKIMLPREREDWNMGGYSLHEREQILKLLQERWRGFSRTRPTLFTKPADAEALESMRPEDNSKPRGTTDEGVDRIAMPDIGEPPEPPTIIDAKSKGWIHNIPVWKEFGHWLKWAVSFATAATVAIGFGEYALGLVFLSLCLVFGLTQIHVWTLDAKPFARWVIKVILALASIGTLAYGAAITLDQKDGKRWGILWQKTTPQNIDQAYEQKRKDLESAVKAQEVIHAQHEAEAAAVGKKIDQDQGEITKHQEAGAKTREAMEAEDKRIGAAKSFDELFPVKQTPSPEVSRPTHFNRVFPIKGGSAQRLSSLLKSAGYIGSMELQELQIGNYETNVSTLYVGSSPDVDASNGVPLLPAESDTQRASSPRDLIDATQIYLFLEKPGKIFVILRSR